MGSIIVGKDTYTHIDNISIHEEDENIIIDMLNKHNKVNKRVQIKHSVLLHIKGFIKQYKDEQGGCLHLVIMGNVDTLTCERLRVKGTVNKLRVVHKRSTNQQKPVNISQQAIYNIAGNKGSILIELQGDFNSITIRDVYLDLDILYTPIKSQSKIICTQSMATLQGNANRVTSINGVISDRLIELDKDYKGYIK